MTWSNGPVTVYHGTDDISAAAIRSKGIDPSKFRRKTDFGAGFYVTTVLHQAEQWANQRLRRTRAATRAEVLRYDISRDTIETLKHLSFVVVDADYYDFVAYCRGGGANHGPAPRAAPYEVVFGPVSLWPQELVVAACDQILFSDPTALQDFKSPVQSLYPRRGAKFFRRRG